MELLEIKCVYCDRNIGSIVADNIVINNNIVNGMKFTCECEQDFVPEQENIEDVV